VWAPSDACFEPGLVDLHNTDTREWIMINWLGSNSSFTGNVLSDWAQCTRVWVKSSGSIDPGANTVAPPLHKNDIFYILKICIFRSTLFYFYIARSIKYFRLIFCTYVGYIIGYILMFFQKKL
jgi:hypothetical protein